MSTTKKPSLFASRLAQQKKDGSLTQPGASLSSTPLVVLGNVVERDALPQPFSYVAAPEAASVCSGASGASAFVPASSETAAVSDSGGESFAQNGDAFSAAQNEADARIAQMSDEQIEAAQREIMATFSDETIRKFKALGDKKRALKNPAFHDKEKAMADAILEYQRDQAIDASLAAPPTPPNDESSKLEWMNPIADTENAPKSSDLRFDLNGQVIPSDADLPHHLGLHHHGDDPSRAGYTIKELIYLARSSVSSQRSMCVQTLVSILKRFMNSLYSPAESHIVGESIRAYMVLIHIRAAIDDTSSTNVSIGIDGIAAAMDITLDKLSNTKSLQSVQSESKLVQRELDEFYRFTKNGHVAFEMNQKSLSEIVNKWTGVLRAAGSSSSSAASSSSGYKEGMSNEEVSSLVISDLIPSLAETHLFERLHFLFINKKLNPTDTELSLRILIRMSRYSIPMATAIAATPGLIQTIRQLYIQVPNWPNVNLNTLRFARLALRLMQSLCQSSLRNPAAVQVLESANAAMRFVSLKPTALSSSSVDPESQREAALFYIDLLTESFRLLSLLFEYGSSTHVFFDLRNEFVNTGMDLLRVVKAIGGSSGFGGGQASHVWTECLSFWKMVVSVGKLARRGVDGVTSLTISPLVFVGVEFFNYLMSKEEHIEKSQSILLALLLDLFSEYLNLVTPNSPAFTDFLSKLSVTSITPLDSIQTALATLHMSSEKTHRSKSIFGVMIPSRQRLEFALQRTINANLVESALIFDAKLAKAGVTTLAIDELCLQTLAALNTSSMRIKNDWTCVYSRGHGDLRSTILLNLVPAIQAPILGPVPEREGVLVKSILHFVRNCLPTDADIFGKVFEGLKWYPGFGDSIPVALKVLEREFGLGGGEEEDAGSVAKRGVESLTISFTSNNLPARPDWMFTTLATLTNEAGVPGAQPLSQKAVTTVVSSTLEFALSLETTSREPQHFNTLKLAALMRVYLLPTLSSGLEVYTLNAVSGLLDRLVDLYDTDSGDLERVFGGQTVFYKFYQELVAQFVHTSFGEAGFARVVRVPLGMRYPYDFRALFWGEVVASGNVVGLLGAVGGVEEKFVEPVETSEVVVDLYLGALVQGLCGVAGGVFQGIAVTHVAG
ncbi:RNA polymerase II associated protein 1, partial [Podochytrium sp. JEL0797]